MPNESPWYSQLRDKWRPQKVKLLLIGESAPDDGGLEENRRFFYAEKLTANDALFRSVVHAVFDVPHLDSRTDSKNVWLERLRDHGVFLIDLVPYPINGANKKVERSRARRESAADCVERAGAIAPDGIIVCHKPSFKVLSKPLRAAGLPLLHDEGIPFPIGNWRADFVTKFRNSYAGLSA
jgi:hypothetical protein